MEWQGRAIHAQVTEMSVRHSPLTATALHCTLLKHCTMCTLDNYYWKPPVHYCTLNSTLLKHITVHTRQLLHSVHSQTSSTLRWPPKLHSTVCWAHPTEHPEYTTKCTLPIAFKKPHSCTFHYKLAVYCIHTESKKRSKSKSFCL